MSEAYSIARVEMAEQQQPPPHAKQDQDIPVLFMHDIERHYRQGDETLHVLNGIGGFGEARRVQDLLAVTLVGP